MMCDQCKGEFTALTDMPSTCTHGYVKMGDTVYERITSYHDVNEECHDCGIVNGNIHHWGCDIERCPKCCDSANAGHCKDNSIEHRDCNGQFISCDCTEDEKVNMIFLTKKEFNQV